MCSKTACSPMEKYKISVVLLWVDCLPTTCKTPSLLKWLQHLGYMKTGRRRERWHLQRTGTSLFHLIWRKWKTALSFILLDKGNEQATVLGSSSTVLAFLGNTILSSTLFSRRCLLPFRIRKHASKQINR